MLVINTELQKSLIDMNEAIECAARALKEFSASGTVTPIRSSLPFYDSRNTALVMPSIAENLGTLGVKVVSVAPTNTRAGKKTINGIVLLLDFETGEPLALLDGAYLTMVRTGAISGIATKYLARKDSKILSVIGTGGQSVGLVEAVLAVRDIERIIVTNRTEQKAVKFADYISEKYHKHVQVCIDPNEAITEADIIVTATNSSTPVFSETLKKGVHVNAIGSYKPTMQELPSQAISIAGKVVVESKEAALGETGDLQIPIKEGVFKQSEIYAELGEIINGELPGRENDEEITLFKSVGLAIVDIVTAKYIYDKAIQNGIGNEIRL